MIGSHTLTLPGLSLSSICLPAKQTELGLPATNVLTVTELTRRIKSLLEHEVGAVWVEGEVSNFRAQASGHCYFTLKDAGAQLSAVLFRGDAARVKFRLDDGLKVVAMGDVSVYEARGQYQIIVRELMPKGLGALQLAFEQLKRKLEAEGLFDPARKKPIPLLPKRIAVVTSPTGAAIRDFLNVIRRRYPNVHIVIAPARVQGEGAAEEIAASVDYLNELHASRQLPFDVIVLARGGGSLEDLWAFNEEIVARAVARSAIPTISAIGHEIDFTICDFVADLRAPTPSAAAELVVQKKEEFAALIEDHSARLKKDLRLRLSEWRERFQRVAQSYVFREPANMIRQYQQRIDDLREKLNRERELVFEQFRRRLRSAAEQLRLLSPRETLRKFEQRFDFAQARLDLLAVQSFKDHRAELRNLRGRLSLLSPRATLQRGYSITKLAKDGILVKSVKAVRAGDRIKTIVKDGEFESEVKQ